MKRNIRETLQRMRGAIGLVQGQVVRVTVTGVTRSIQEAGTVQDTGD